MSLRFIDNRTLAKIVALLAAVMVLLSACGRDPDIGLGDGSTASFPVTVQAGNGSITLNARPERIVSLSPTATETLFAIGAAKQVVAVDDQSNYPAEAPKTALSGFTPNAEAIAGYKPDLVVLSNDLNGIVASLGRLNVPVMLQPSAVTLDDTYSQIRALGTASGNVTSANKLAGDMRTDIEKLFTSAPRPTTPLKTFHELDNTLYTVTSKSFVGQIYQRFGYQNIADAADPSGSGYPQLSAEYLVQQNPDVIFLADTKCCGQSLSTVAARPGFAELKAVRTNNVVALDDDIASRWGPRVVELVRAISQATSKAQAA